MIRLAPPQLSDGIERTSTQPVLEHAFSLDTTSLSIWIAIACVSLVAMLAIGWRLGLVRDYSIGLSAFACVPRIARARSGRPVLTADEQGLLTSVSAQTGLSKGTLMLCKPGFDAAFDAVSRDGTLEVPAYRVITLRSKLYPDLAR